VSTSLRGVLASVLLIETADWSSTRDDEWWDKAAETSRRATRRMAQPKNGS